MSCGNDGGADMSVMCEYAVVAVLFIPHRRALLVVGCEYRVFAREANPDITCEKPFGFFCLLSYHCNGVADVVDLYSAISSMFRIICMVFVRHA